jgi:hypothetical protein
MINSKGNDEEFLSFMMMKNILKNNYISSIKLNDNFKKLMTNNV